MKSICLSATTGFLLLILFASSTMGQESPPASAENTVDGIKITIKYHSPRVKGRQIWGELEPYDKVWRTGANNATTLEVSANARIGKNKLPAGKYALFTIPKVGDTWTVIINKVADQWGAYNYDAGEDLFRFDVKVDRTLELHEELKFEVSDNGTVTFAWEYKSFKFKIEK